MYDRNDLKIDGNRILVKEYTGSELDGVKHYNWETLLEINRNKCIYALHMTMLNLLETFV